MFCLVDSQLPSGKVLVRNFDLGPGRPCFCGTRFPLRVARPGIFAALVAPYRLSFIGGGATRRTHHDRVQSRLIVALLRYFLWSLVVKSLEPSCHLVSLILLLCFPDLRI